MAAEASALSVSVICSLSKGENWPLHARYDAGQGRFSDLILTTVRQAECVSGVVWREGTAHRPDSAAAPTTPARRAIRGAIVWLKGIERQ